MGRGLGEHQKAILAAVANQPWGATVRQLSERTGRSMRQTRAAVTGLERRGLVVVTRNESLGWTDGVGSWSYADSIYTQQVHDPGEVLSVAEGEPLPSDFARWPGETAWKDLRLVRRGVPQHGSIVWDPMRRRMWEKGNAATLKRIDDALHRER